MASPRAIALTARALTALRALAKVPDMAPAQQELDAVLTGLLGSPSARFEDAGLSTARGFALFVTADGVAGALPVGDRAKFVATKHGRPGTNEDDVNGKTCKPVRGFYVCATSDAMFDRLGKGALRGKAAALAGAPGDLEVYAPGVALLGGAPGDLAITAKLAAGQLDARARWTGTPAGALGKLAGARAPHPDVTGASGFVTLNLAPLLADLPALPVAGGVTLDQLGKSVKGPVEVEIPAGTVDLEIHVPLSDPAPARTIIEHCSELDMFQLADVQTPGACRFELQATSSLEVDAWVEGDELRLGAHKGKPPAGRPGAVTAAGGELARGDWTAAFWGRGTMLESVGRGARHRQSCPRRRRSGSTRSRSSTSSASGSRSITTACARERSCAPRGRTRPTSRRRSSRSPATTSSTARRARPRRRSPPPRRARRSPPISPPARAG